MNNNMWNGFFNLEDIKDENILKQFFIDALSVSTKSSVQILKSWRREHYDDITENEFIDKHLKLYNHNTCVDRFEYNQKASWADQIGEICSSTFGSQSLFLYIYLDLNELYKLVEKYNLNKKQF